MGGFPAKMDCRETDVKVGIHAKEPVVWKF